MKMFGKIAAFVSAFGLLLALFGCSNASGGGTAVTAPTAPTTDNPVSVNSSKILDLRIKKNGVLYTGAGTSASVASNFSKSLSAANGISFAQIGGTEQVPGDGWDEKLWTQDRHQTSHVKVENAIVDNVPGLKFTITRPTSKYFDPYYKISKESEWYEWVGDNNGNYEHKGWKYVGAGNGDHVLQGATYEWLGDKKGDYDNYRHEEVGAGKGAFIKVCDNYTLLTTNTGDYVETGFEFVGEGNGIFEKCQSSSGWYLSFYEYVGAGNGNIDYDLTYDGPRGHYKNVGEGQGSYKLVEGYDCEDVGWDFDNDKGNGSYLRKVIRVDRSSGEWVSWIYDPVCKWVEFGNGDWNEKADYVGQGNGDYIKKEHCKWVGDGNGDYVETFEEVGENQGAYVKHENWIYGGWNYVGITRLEDLNGNGDRIWTTRAPLSTEKWNEKVNTCFYPLCEPNERYVFIIELKSIDANFHSGDPDYEIQEFLSIKAQDGIGDIDYSNLDPSRNLEVKYDGEKPIAIVKNCVPPKNTNELLSVLQVFAGNRDWQGDSSHWIADYKRSGDMMQFDKDPCMEMIRRDWTTKDENGNERHFTEEEVENMRSTQCFNAMLKSKGKKEFYVAHYFSFSVPEAQGIEEFRSKYIESEVVPIK